MTSSTLSNYGTLPTRAPWQQPFSDNSFLNIGVGTGAQWDNGSAAAQQLHSLTGVINTTDWGIGQATGTGSDPLVAITNPGDGNTPSTQYMHVPTSAQPPGGTDRDMAFFDATQPWLTDSVFDVQFNNGANSSGGITGGLGAVLDTTGNGLTAPPGDTNALVYDYAGGVINSYDLQQGAIDHMMRVSISANAEMMPNGSTYYTTNIPWPDDHVDYNGPSAFTGLIPAGSTFGIPSNVNLSTLGLSQGGLMLAKALQDYGAYWNDTGGTNQFTLSATPETASSPLMQQMQADFQKLMPYIAIMTNQSATNVNGGGSYPYEATTPLAAPGLDIAHNIAPALNVGKSAAVSGTVITQPGQTITDAGGNAWSIYNGEVDLNGVLDSSAPNTSAVAYVGGTIWNEQANGQWSSYLGSGKGWSAPTGVAPVTVPSSGGSTGGTAPTPAPNDTVITPNSGSIVDASGNAWAITSSGSITENGSIDSYSFSVAEMAYVNGNVYQENTSGQWYQQPASPGWWTAAPNPLPSTTVGTGNNGGGGAGGNGNTSGMTPLSGLTWPTHTVTWAFANAGTVSGLGTVTSAVTDPAKQAQITAGISAWAKVSGITLQQVSNPAQANIEVGYGNPSGLIGENIWGYNPSTSQYTGDLVLLQDPAIGGGLTTDASGKLSYNDGVELGQLATHEFGAGIGLAEGSGTDTASVMNHVLTSANRVPDAADIAAAQSLYGAPPVTQSPNDTVITPNSGSIVDAAGNVWKITSAGSITENGITDQYSFGVAEMAYVGGQVWQENTSGQWYSQPSSPGWWTTGTNPLPSSGPPAWQDLTVTVPVSIAAVAGSPTKIAGIAISDPWAATQPGTLTLKVSDTAGVLAVGGQTIPAGTVGTVTGSLTALNTDLATMTYTSAGPGTDAIIVDVTNQGGDEVKQTVAVTSAQPTITLSTSNLTPTVSANNSAVTGSGSFTAYIGGSGDTVTLTGGTERVYLFGGHDAVTAGSGNDEAVLASTGDTVSLGTGANTVLDASQGGNTIVLPPSGQGTLDIWGNVMGNGDVLDFRPMLAGTNWTGSTSTLSQYLKVATAANGTDATISVSATAGGSTTAVATLHGAAGLTLATLQSHATL